MAKVTDKFYNMQINLIRNGKLYAENVAIRNIWEKDRNIFLDIYFHRLQKSFIFDSSFIRGIFDVTREKHYTDIHKFVADFNAEADVIEPQPVTIPKKETSCLTPINNDMIILSFMSKVWGNKSQIKDKIIIDYIQATIAAAQSLSETYLLSYISSFQPEETDFYTALTKIKAKQPKQAEFLLREAIKICLSDGCLHYAERMYLADIIQTLRNEGLRLPADLI